MLGGGGRGAGGGLSGRDRHVQSGLDAFDALQQRGLGVAGRREQQPSADDFEQQTRRRCPTHLAQSGVHHLRITRECGLPDTPGLIAHPVQHITGGVDDTARRGIRNRLQHDEVAEPLQQVGGEPARIVTGVDHRLHRAEQGGGVAGGQGVHRVIDQRDVGGTEQGQCALVTDPVVLRAGQKLIEHAQRVAGRATAGPDHQGEDRVVHVDLFTGQDSLQ